jgi:hypothetical protein
VLPARYKHHLHIKKWIYPRKRQWRPVVFPVRYEHHLHIKKVNLSPSQAVEAYCVSCDVRKSSTYTKVKLPRNKLWSPRGLWDVQVSIFPKQSAHIWRWVSALRAVHPIRGWANTRGIVLLIMNQLLGLQAGKSWSLLSLMHKLVPEIEIENASWE